MSLRDVPPENEFVLVGGKRIKNIAELGRELKTMSGDVFAHHVTREKNDFASWIDACVKDTKLGTLVRMTKEQQRMAAIVERHIQEQTRPPIKIVKPIKIEQTMPEPSIVRTKNVTLLTLAHGQPEAKKEPLKVQKEIIHPPHKTILKLTHENTALKTSPEPIMHAHQPHLKTHLSLAHDNAKEIYIHEVNKHHHGAALLIGHLVLGIVVGVAIAALVLAFNT
jgi:hypothetical protein